MPFRFIDRVETKLGLSVTPLVFPLEWDMILKEIYNIYDKKH